MVATLQDEEEARLRKAVAKAETRTSAEIVVMVMRGVTDYRTVEVLVAAIAALALPAVLLPFTMIPALTIWVLQMSLFACLVLALPLLSLGRFFVGKERVRRDVAAAAQAEFFAHGLRRTEKRAAVLLFVAMREHRVQILYDDGAKDIVPAEAWERLADMIAAELAKGAAVTGLETAVAATADYLEGDFPPVPGKKNELPDVVVG